MKFHTTIHGHSCKVEMLRNHGAGTYDVEVLVCATCAGLIGKCFRISGMPLFAERFASAEHAS